MSELDHNYIWIFIATTPIITKSRLWLIGEGVTEGEIRFCNLVSGHLDAEKYSCMGLKFDVEDQIYSFHVHRLGNDSTRQDKPFKVFPDQFFESVRSNKLPEGLRRELDCQYGMQFTGRWSGSGT